MLDMRVLGLLTALSTVALGTACGGGDDLAADAGEDITVGVGAQPSFDGCDSTGDIVNYAWAITEAPAAMAGDVGKSIRETDSSCSFTLEATMIADEAGDWVIELTVTDADGGAATDTVAVSVRE